MQLFLELICALADAFLSLTVVKDLPAVITTGLPSVSVSVAAAAAAEQLTYAQEDAVFQIFT